VSGQSTLAVVNGHHAALRNARDLTPIQPKLRLASNRGVAVFGGERAEIVATIGHYDNYITAYYYHRVETVRTLVPHRELLGCNMRGSDLRVQAMPQ